MFPENPWGRIGTYYHLLPTYAQGKKILWDGIDAQGFRTMDHFPPAIVKSRNEQELRVELKNGSAYQIIGTDKIDSIVGTNPVGCLFSEYALQNPLAWDLIRPILLENGGWAIFLYTPRGRNHGKHLYDMARLNPDWYCERLTVEDTYLDNGQRVITDEMIEEERASGMAEELIQQEYYCSFEGAQMGAYYAKQLALAESDGRIGDVPWLSTSPVFTFWDLGVDDATAIWFCQIIDGRWYFIDHEEHSGEGYEFYAKLLQDKPYRYQRHYWPHDGGNRSQLTGTRRCDKAEEMGIRPIEVLEKADIETGIAAVRGQFSRWYFDRRKCARGLECLSEYHKEWDELNHVHKNRPLHNWASHTADAARTAAMSGAEWVAREDGTELVVRRGYDPRDRAQDYNMNVQVIRGNGHV